MKERAKKEVQKEQAEAEAPIINPGSTLLLTNGFAGQAPPPMMNGGMPPVSSYSST